MNATFINGIPCGGISNCSYLIDGIKIDASDVMVIQYKEIRTKNSTTTYYFAMTSVGCTSFYADIEEKVLLDFSLDACANMTVLIELRDEETFISNIRHRNWPVARYFIEAYNMIREKIDNLILGNEDSDEPEDEKSMITDDSHKEDIMGKIKLSSIYGECHNPN